MRRLNSVIFSINCVFLKVQSAKDPRFQKPFRTSLKILIYSAILFILFYIILLYNL
jgi:hypothetical protein